MKIVCLNSSPRKNGNSTTISTEFTDTAQQLGAKVNTYYLNTLDFKGCQACQACKNKKAACVLKDDLTPVLEDIRTAHILVLATPVYFADVASQAKQFIDRTYSYYVPDFTTNPHPSRLETGKRLVFIQTQNQENQDMFNDIFPKYDFFFQVLGFTNNVLIRACGVNKATDAKKDRHLMDMTQKQAEKIMAAME
ncbi:MAG: flavodoxin family protein [Desulfobacteraceae bacterium]|nr:flavodoxin family protein [Desulfobacteraceae bacterium]